MKTLAGTSALFWFRRDLRVTDNAGLYRALTSAGRVYCVFVFDRAILGELPSKLDRRVEFIWESIAELKRSLRALGGELIVRHAFADTEIPGLAQQLKVHAVFTNEDYEPVAAARDARVRESLASLGIAFHACKDTVIFAKDEVLTQAGGTYCVFTPYKNAWLKKVNDFWLKSYPVEEYAGNLAKPGQAEPLPSLASIGFERTNLKALSVRTGESGAHELLADFVARMEDYQDARDFPAARGVSYLSVHNRFGTISIRELASIAYAETLRKKNPGAETWLGELIWRDFYFQILYHHPHTARSAFRREYDAIKWPNDPALFEAWCEARTGYPIIDAAMRQLHETGYMHNRLRMIVASFLTKDLLIDWRWGEKYFADHLIDYDLAANNGGWQWAASTGCDAQPYFRIFNPVTQSQRFDPRGKFIRRYLPALSGMPDKYVHAPWTLPPADQQACGMLVGRDYPPPVVDHAVQRVKALALYATVKG
ncbi:MAG: deoxyribodipyrimidine photo-lyase [Betaproteobacteria bacterium]